MLVAVAFDTLLAAALFMSLLRGEAAERVGAIIGAVGTIATVVAAEPIATRFLGPSQRLMSIDTAVVFGYVCIALRSRKFWPIWASACQLLAASAAFEIGFTAHGWSVPAALSEQVWGWPPLLMILWATRPRWTNRMPLGAR